MSAHGLDGQGAGGHGLSGGIVRFLAELLVETLHKDGAGGPDLGRLLAGGQIAGKPLGGTHDAFAPPAKLGAEGGDAGGDAGQQDGLDGRVLHTGDEADVLLEAPGRHDGGVGRTPFRPPLIVGEALDVDAGVAGCRRAPWAT